MKIETSGNIMRISGGVTSGDASRIGRVLGSNIISEIHLNSPGGDSAEGMRIGLMFREHRSFVRVADNASCASACTVAFLGGRIRAIDDNASYLVHIYSGYMDGFDRYDGKSFESTKFQRADKTNFVWKHELVKDPKGFLRWIQRDTHGFERVDSAFHFLEKSRIVREYNSLRSERSAKVALRFSYLRNMIQPIEYRTSEDAIYREGQALTAKLEKKRIESYQHYMTHKLEEDVAQIKRGGASVAHIIAKRIERDTAFNIIAGICEINETGKTGDFIASNYKATEVADKLFSLCKISRFDDSSSSKDLLGPRSSHALRMIITMFESRINSTSKLSQETLYNYGFKNLKNS
ncbi:hypothetical protein [Glaciecola sp. 1036]|uniref:hypothetical protein n=1 Tax=Alteromonadaceae TaxID=72275 RepID=UPI003CFCB15E